MLRISYCPIFQWKRCNKESTHKKYDNIYVLFTDIVSYTELAKRYDDTVMYRLLNDIYTHFDNIIIKYKNLQKIETIGDAYMVVGDLYNNNNNNIVNDIIELAIEFMKEIKNIKTPDNIMLQLRIGINIGSVSIGILGVDIPRLCVIGNTVNIAARLQSTADPDTIQLSKSVYENVNNKEKFNFIVKENVFLKNIGSVITYNIKYEIEKE